MDVIRKEKTAESAIDTARALDVEKEPELEGQSHERKNITLEDDIEHLRLQYGSTWSTPSDLNNPQTFPSHRKIMIGILFSLGQLIPIMSASMIAPCLPSIAWSLHISASASQITMSSYFLGMAFAPLLIATSSEIYGRKKAWVVCNVVYIVGNAVCGIEKGGLAVMVLGRIVSGAGASVGVTLNGPVMADMYGASERGKSLAIVTLLPYLGPALGPLVGGLVTQVLHWKWVFWVMSIADSIILLIGLFIIRETYTPVLLRHKALREGIQIPPRRSDLRTALLRPVHILTHRPIIWLITLVNTVAFGAYVLMLSTYAKLWINEYHQSELVSSLHYIAIALGSTIAGQIGSRVLDHTYRTLSKRHSNDGVPEYRIPYFIPGVFLMPAGLVWYGWSAAYKVHWILVDIGTVVFTLGSFIASQAVMAYQLDEFAEFGASASAASRVVSYVLAFACPIFAPQMYATLGYGWGNSLLAFVVLGLIGPSCWVFWRWGYKIRAVGRKS